MEECGGHYAKQNSYTQQGKYCMISLVVASAKVKLIELKSRTWLPGIGFEGTGEMLVKQVGDIGEMLVKVTNFQL